MRLTVRNTSFSFRSDEVCKNTETIGGGGSNPIFAHGKIVSFPIFPHGKKWGKKYMEREGNEYFSLFFLILFFPFFPMGKNGKRHIFPWAKMGLDPPPNNCNRYLIVLLPYLNFTIYIYYTLNILSKSTVIYMGRGSNPILAHFCPSPNPDFNVSWAKMGKKYMEREGKSIRFNTLSVYYYHCFLHIKLDISCYILHDSVMNVSS